MKRRAHPISRPKPRVSAFAAQFVDKEEADDDDAFFRQPRDRHEAFLDQIRGLCSAARARMAQEGRKAGFCATGAVVAFFVAMNTGGGFAIGAWIVMLALGTRAIFALEAWNVVRI